MIKKAADILDLKSGKISLLTARGFNSLALLKTSSDAAHKYPEYPEVVVKFLRRDCPKERFDEIARWHNENFGKFPVLKSIRFQQSLEAGIYTDKYGKTYFYSVVEYICGTVLQDFIDLAVPLNKSLCKSIVVQLFESIIIPAWACGLTFPDIQGRNFILRNSGNLSMLDTEQMRRSAAEILAKKNSRIAREMQAHLAFHSAPEKTDFNGPLPRLLKNLLFAAFFPDSQTPGEIKAKIMPAVRKLISDRGLADMLMCGRRDILQSQTSESLERFLESLFAACEKI